MGRKKKPLRQLAELPLSQIPLNEDALNERHGEESIAELAHSMADKGQLAPILVCEAGRKDTLKLLMGCRRHLAAKRLGWDAIAAIVLERSLHKEIGVIEKLQAGNCSPWEAAEGLSNLKEKLDWTQAQVGQAIGRNRDFVANLLAIARITPEARAYILNHNNGKELTSRHLRYVGRAAPGKQVGVAQRILGKHLSTTELEREKRDAGGEAREIRFFKVRSPRRPGAANFPKTLGEWKKYYRQLNTDLRRMDRQEREELRRTRERIAEAKQRQQLLKKEALRRRKELQREMRQARRQLGRQVGY